MIVNNDYDQKISSFYINSFHSRLSTVVEITNPNYKVNFNVENFIGPILGFEKEILSFGYNKSPKIVHIMKINFILINVDFLYGSYINGDRSQAIHSLFSDVEPGNKIRERPQAELIFYSVNCHYVNHIRVCLTNRIKDLMDLQGERITVKIVIRELKQ